MLELKFSYVEEWWIFREEGYLIGSIFSLITIPIYIFKALLANLK